MFARHFLAVATTLALVSSTTLGNPEILAVVTQATDATLRTGQLSVGASIYDGDRLSTDAAGALTVRGAAAILYLARASRMTLRSLPNKAKGTQADLNAGSLAFSVPNAAALVLFANSARIRGIGDAATARSSNDPRPEDAGHLCPSRHTRLFVSGRKRGRSGR
jgi:hypothetical protein